MSDMNHVHGVWWVVQKDGRFFMHDAKGEKIKGEIFCRIHDENNELPIAIVKMIVNIAGSEEEMMQKIKELEA